jgi:hypothetical protein
MAIRQRWPRAGDQKSRDLVFGPFDGGSSFSYTSIAANSSDRRPARVIALAGSARKPRDGHDEWIADGEDGVTEHFQPTDGGALSEVRPLPGSSGHRQATSAAHGGSPGLATW